MINIMNNKLGSDFSKLWAGNVVSALGDGAILSAGPLLVASITQNPALVAGAVFAQQLPWLLFSLLSGVYVDRLDRRQVMIAANLLRAVAIGGLALTIAAGAASIPIIYSSLFILGVGNTFADNAAVALLPSIIETSSLSKANSLLQSANLVGKQLAGPPLGAYLFVAAAAVPFGLDALTFVVAALFIGWIRKSNRSDQQVAAQPRRSVQNEIKEGIQWLWRSPFLRTLAFSIAILNITFTAAFSLFVLFVDQRLGLDAVGYGLMLTSSAMGGLIGSFIAHPLESKFSAATLLRAGLVTEALIDVSFAVVRSPGAAGVLYALFGLHAVIWGVITVSLRQKLVPSHLLGRVNSVYNVFRMGGVAIGALLGGIVAQAYGITAPFWMAAVTVGLLTLVTWRAFGQYPEISEQKN